MHNNILARPNDRYTHTGARAPTTHTHTHKCTEAEVYTRAVVLSQSRRDRDCSYKHARFHS